MTRAALLVACIACAVTASCGGPSDPPRPPPRKAPPALEPIDDDAIVADAIQRLIAGPGTDLLRMGIELDEKGAIVATHATWDVRVHATNTELAIRDVLALPDSLARRLSDVALVRRLTEVHPENEGSWGQVLDLITRAEGIPWDVVERWVRPVLDGRGTEYTRRRAMRTLAASRDPRAHAALLSFVTAADPSPEAIDMALATLLRAAPGVRAAAMRETLRHGDGKAWFRVKGALVGDLGVGAPDHDRLDALAWWAALVEGSGPTVSNDPPPVKRAVPGRIAEALDPAVLASVPGRALGLRPAPTDGWLRTSGERDLVQATIAHLFVGWEPAGEARCELAYRGAPPWVAGIARDRAAATVDAERARRAAACRLAEDRPAISARARDTLVHWLNDPGAQASEGDLQQAIIDLPEPAADPVARDILRDVLEKAPAGAAGDRLAQRAYERLAAIDVGVADRLMAMIVDADEARSTRARTILMAHPDRRFLPAIEGHVASLSGVAADNAWLRALAFVARIPDRAPEETRRWVDALARRIDDADEETGASLVGALLDLGPEGALRFAEGLRGPLRARYVRGWPQGIEPVPVEVAHALLEPLSGESAFPDVVAALQLAWRTFPPDAAPAVAALLDRLPRSRRTAVLPVFHRIRHRAPIR